MRLAWTLAPTDFKLKFFGSFLGYLWQLVNPLLLFGVLFLVFSFALISIEGVRYYPVGLLLGIVLFSFLGEAAPAVRSLLQRETLVRKVDFPRLGRADGQRADRGLQPRAQPGAGVGVPAGLRGDGRACTWLGCSCSSSPC